LLQKIKRMTEAWILIYVLSRNVILITYNIHFHYTTYGFYVATLYIFEML
jgi:hypothetical protein